MIEKLKRIMRRNEPHRSSNVFSWRIMRDRMLRCLAGGMPRTFHQQQAAVKKGGGSVPLVLPGRKDASYTFILLGIKWPASSETSLFSTPFRLSRLF